MIEEEFLENRAQAATVAARRIVDALEPALNATAHASLVVSGGSTPAETYERLSKAALDWSRVHVVPSDERWVEPIDDDSNERMLVETLLVGKAEEATLVSLYRQGMTPAAASEAVDRELRDIPLPFTAVVLGMGVDGHFASLFPDANNLAEGLDADGARYCLPVDTAASPHPRVTLTLAALLNSREIVLLFYGDAKRKVYEHAKSPDSDLPVSRLLNQSRAPVRVVWAP